MLSSRIIKRIPSAKIKERAALHNWCVNFNKKSIDGSGKANLSQKTGFITWGCLYEIDANEISRLDGIEKGYIRIKVNVIKDDGVTVEAETYISDNITDNPVAFDSYKQLLISGSTEHNLPAEYVLYLQQLPSKPDTQDK